MLGDFNRHCQVEATLNLYAFLKVGGVEKFFVDEKLRAVDVIAVNAVNFRAGKFLPNGKPTSCTATDIDDTARVNQFGDNRQNTRSRGERCILLSAIEIFVVSLITRVSLFSFQMNSSQKNSADLFNRREIF